MKALQGFYLNRNHSKEELSFGDPAVSSISQRMQQKHWLTLTDRLKEPP